MANIKDTKRRIGSVKNTQKITRAMKLVSAAKYSKANQAVLNARPYGDAFDAMVQRLVSATENYDASLLKKKEVKRMLFVMIGTDRGLCGGLNSNFAKACGKFLDQQKKDGIKVDLILMGKRSQLFGKKRSEEVVLSEEKILEKPSYARAKKLAEDLSKWFVNDKYDQVTLGYSKFINAMTQEPVTAQLLPIHLEKAENEAPSNFIFEPSAQAFLDEMLDKKIASQLFRTFLEGAASEHAARMTAMDSATTNAEEVIKRLTLQYNRARQAAITTELIEITSGAEAL